jgi:hypothetical protein
MKGFPKICLSFDSDRQGTVQMHFRVVSNRYSALRYAHLCTSGKSHTRPRTGFQVLGHVKTVAVLAVGWLLFDTAVTMKMTAGAVCALCGVVLYSSGFVLDKAPSMDACGESSNARKV